MTSIIFIHEQISWASSFALLIEGGLQKRGLQCQLSSKAGARRILKEKQAAECLVILIEGSRYPTQWAARLQAEYPSVKVLLHQLHHFPGHIHEMYEAGLWGYMLWSQSIHQCCRAIEDVLDGKKAFQEKVWNMYEQYHFMGEATNKGDFHVNQKEYDLIRAYSEGKTHAEIGHQLGLSIIGVDACWQHLTHKLQRNDPYEMLRLLQTQKNINLHVEGTKADL